MKTLLLGLILLAGLAACTRQTQPANLSEKSPVHINFLHINDVYEIAGLSGGTHGHLARVGYLKDSLSRHYPNLYLILSGDFLNPSVFGTIPYEGKPLRGRQMIEALNAAGLDFATFGNHEFDIRESQLLERIEESDFAWVSSNVFHQQTGGPRPFMHRGKPIPTHHTFRIPYGEADTFKLAMLGLCLDYNKAAHAFYTDVNQTAQRLTDSLSPHVNGIVAMTHLNLIEDRALAAAVPQIRLLMGGHDHDNMYEKVGQSIIAKADANARTAYLHQISFDPKTQKIAITSTLMPLSAPMPKQARTQEVVDRWMRIAYTAFEEQGYDPKNQLLPLSEEMDMREAMLRNQQCSSGQFFVKALQAAMPDADAWVVTGGSVRIDDVLEGVITEYDVMRMLPFGGQVMSVQMSGRTLSQFLNAGRSNRGSGGYLQRSQNLRYDAAQNTWFLNDKPILDEQRYTIGLNDYILTGNERNMPFMSPQKNPDLSHIQTSDDPTDPRSDIRRAVIAYLKML
ncbi:MAG: bifunctional metallophosphatase/5'-nucleotidase [Bernardetiaceae bacterium]